MMNKPSPRVTFNPIGNTVNLTFHSTDLTLADQARLWYHLSVNLGIVDALVKDNHNKAIDCIDAQLNKLQGRKKDAKPA